MQNVVCMVHMGCQLDLDIISLELPNVKYTKKFSGAIFRSSEPKGTALLFRNGKVVLNGCKSVKQGENLANYVAEELRHLGFEANMRDFAVQLVVGSFNAGFCIDMEGVQKETNGSLEQELFPGLIIRFQKPKVTCTVFHSGRGIITGAKHEYQIEEAYAVLLPLLQKHRKS